MLTDIAASLLAKAINTSATSTTCLYTNATTLSIIGEESLYRNLIACAMQHLRCKQQTLKKSQLYCQKRMCFGRWHHCCDNTNIFNAIGNIIIHNQMLMLLLDRHCGQLNKTTNKNILIKRHKRLNNKNNNLKGFRGSGGVSMKLFRASSSMFNNRMMCDSLKSKFRGSLTISLFLSNGELKPKSKWHSALKSNQANHGLKSSTTTTSSVTTTATTRLTEIALTEPVQQKKQVHTITITTNSEKSESIILMIQEPQQPEIIEIPLIDQSMNTTVQSSLNRNLMLKNPNNSKQKTLIQIKPINSKPRIFLLTRPSKSQLVRLETHRVPPHHPQKITATTPAIIGSPTQSQILSQKKIIRIPFLPRSQAQTFSVKSNINQVLKKDTIIVPQEIVQYTNENHNTDQESSQTQTQLYSIIQKNTNQTKQLSPSCPTITAETSSNQSVKNNTIPKSTVTKTSQSETQAQTQAQVPLTLASMAGIELTGADMSLSQADMSGAMPPTATVEEINVPVFIDEYLQEATAPSTTPVTANIFNINNNNNNNTSNNLSNNNNQRNEKGNEVNNCLDTLENFEFDIDLLTENTCKDKETTTLELHEEEQQQHPHHNQQQQLIEVDDDKKEHHQLDLQLMLEDILFNNKNNISNYNNNSCKENNILNNINNNTTSINNYTLNNMTNMATSPDFLDELDSRNSIFNVAPYSQMGEDILTPDDKFLENMDNSSIGTLDLPTCEYAVDFNFVTNEPSLKDCFLHSQPTDIMFSSGFGLSSSSLSSSQNLINEISKAEPHIQNIYPDSTYSILPTTSSAIALESGICETSEDTQYNCTPQYFVESQVEDCKESKTLSNSLKRHSSQTRQHMKDKRLKLRLDMKTCKENVLPQQIEINTPNVINILDEFAEHSMGPTAENSIDSIYNHLISTSPTCTSIKSEINIEDTSVDFSPPNTPYSVNSISNQTNFTGFSAPSSPASSVTTTTNASIKTKRGRGRPAKTHSYIPDLSLIKHLSENEQKKILERAKNNEASRKSRLKHKERDTALEREEQELKQRNLELNTKLKKYKTMEKKLHKALKRQHFQYYSQNK